MLIVCSWKRRRTRRRRRRRWVFGSYRRMSGDGDDVCSIGVQTRMNHYYYYYYYYCGNSSWHLSPGVC
jgi:hypothetical protein